MRRVLSGLDLCSLVPHTCPSDSSLDLQGLGWREEPPHISLTVLDAWVTSASSHVICLVRGALKDWPVGSQVCLPMDSVLVAAVSSRGHKQSVSGPLVVSMGQVPVGLQPCQGIWWGRAMACRF